MAMNKIYKEFKNKLDKNNSYTVSGITYYIYTSSDNVLYGYGVIGDVSRKIISLDSVTLLNRKARVSILQEPYGFEGYESVEELLLNITDTFKSKIEEIHKAIM